MTLLKEWADLLRIIHGGFNAAVALALFYQGWLGIKIRRERRAAGARDFSAVKRHRAYGPLLALLGIAGYLAGAALVIVDKGHLLQYPVHHLTGAAIAVLLAATYLISRRITAPVSVWRTPHFILGLTLLWAYVVQLLLGLNILL
ncbi:MAG: DUF4079 family protein [Deltaproteobacteria bacterium]|nr:DUF4079 family protein [Deltaproteobacteria bacterium]